MDQRDFDELDAEVIHLLADDRQSPVALCSGLPWEPTGTRRAKKLCPACRLKALALGAEGPAGKKHVQ